ncbi:hypothetical protein C8J56DRAFT_1040671 [Mycena floridula]|nr:hypothetical protein C8J56DRAFT_1040671 [Mycena floridula]
MASLAHLLNPVEPTPVADSTEPPDIFAHSTAPSTIHYDVKINRTTTLARMYVFNTPGAYIEYPETLSDRPIGYLLRCDPERWKIPSGNFAYSLGSPGGHRAKGTDGNDLQVNVLKHMVTDLKVPCTETHYTCQGVKVCPYSDLDSLQTPHTRATRGDISKRLALDRDARLLYASPSAAIFSKTQALIAGIRRTGCRAVRQEETYLSFAEEQHISRIQQLESTFKRGYQDKVDRCEGRMVFGYDNEGKSFVACEHYDSEISRDHVIYYMDGSYDEEYLEAVLEEDTEEIERIERAAEALGYGPRVTCTTIANASTQRAFCPHDHRGSDGLLLQSTMVRMECKVQFRIYQPVEQYRTACPYILITVKGVHPHPVPLPLKTPPEVKALIMDLIDKMGTDLPDLTARRFLRHPVVRGYLRDKFPLLPAPTFSQIHVSLANRAHLFSYIQSASKKKFPKGTGWEGARLMKKIQDEDGSILYLRRMIEVSASGVTRDVADEEPASEWEKDLRILVCDNAFKRIVGFKEFELAAIDRDANTSVVFCRVFMTRETAFAHKLVFQAIHDIVKEDTGHELKWRHLWATSLDDFDGYVLQFTSDQHGGQAKGLGLYLQDLAQDMPFVRDLHEPERLVASLSPYEHLHRIFRLCVVHIHRYIRSCKVPDSVRDVMRSLICITHPNWNAALAKIKRDGKKAGEDWIKNKINSHFAFEGMCHEKSFIPLPVWQAGDSTSNVIESVHYNVNIDGKGCTLLGGIEKGQSFDFMRLNTLEAWEESGVRPSYGSGHTSENASRGIKRRFDFRHRTLLVQDRTIDKHLAKLHEQFEEVTAAQEAVQEAQKSLDATDPVRYQQGLQRLQKLQTVHGKASRAYNELLKSGSELARGTDLLESSINELKDEPSTILSK